MLCEIPLRTKVIGPTGGRQLEPEECKADDHEHPVHEDCYVAIALANSQIRDVPEQKGIALARAEPTISPS